ncbi:uncharacterized protein LOC125845909 [Solanum stenotomum]|uniref:uncharacterized protein LOC125845909 n=1 Tax=Solanum stenotomum TaxID=172797 RepID=UPI0020D15F3A|nr:uncharacterized protein LOC125845909 [Solanum stenotomum]
MGVSEKVQKIKRELMDKQRSMRTCPNPQGSTDEEKALREKLAKWSMIKENIYKQKSRVQWLKLGDENNAYFFASVKGRKAQNQINMLTKEDDIVIREATSITKEAVGFYKKLLGQCSNHMQATQPDILKDGPVLTREQQLFLIQPFKDIDVKATLMSMRDSKAPGGDGFNSYFFKKAWLIIREELTSVVLQFFQTTEIVMNYLVDPGQAAFVPGRMLTDKLVKGYGRKGISPRCMFKIDMQKAYDYLEWHFLEEVLAGRLQLVNSVLTSMQAFWTQFFLLPKQVLKRVETMCKRFLWNGETQVKEKALIAWDTLCLPKVAG